MSHYKIESWQQRKAGIRVRLRIPKFIFSHRYIGTCDAEYFGARGITFHYKRSTETAFSSPVVADNTLRSHENKDRAVDDLRLASCRSPFDVFCARVTARAARSARELSRKDLVRLWQGQSADIKAEYIQYFRSYRTSDVRLPPLLHSDPTVDVAQSNEGECTQTCSATDPNGDAESAGVIGDIPCTENFADEIVALTASTTAPSRASGRMGRLPRSSAAPVADPDVPRVVVAPQMHVVDLIAAYSTRSAPGEVLQSHLVEFCGVVRSRRDLSSRLIFLDLVDVEDCATLSSDWNGATDSETHASPQEPCNCASGADSVTHPMTSHNSAEIQPVLQVVANSKWLADSDETAGQRTCDARDGARRVLRGDVTSCSVGDTVLVKGHPGRTRTGSGDGHGFSLFATSFVLLRCHLTKNRVVRAFVGLHLRTTSTAAVARLLDCSTASVPVLAQLAKPHVQTLLAAHQCVPLPGGALENPPTGEIHAIGPEPTARRQHLLAKARAQRLRGCFVVLERPGNPGNIAPIARTCDALGATQLLIVGPRLDLLTTASMRQSASAVKWVDIVFVDSVPACDAHIKRQPQGQHVVHYGTALHSDCSKELHDINFLAPAPAERRNDSAKECATVTTMQAETPIPIALWFGNEVSGLSSEALEICSTHVVVPMCGIVESMNLSVTVGIVLAEALRQRKRNQFFA
eukprot:m.654316 g.654316  ORF g.654316 m.654316 type:complete len:692 (+) comp22691_c2_seq70:3574-5649(+)